MTAQTYDIEVEQGATFTLNLVHKESEGAGTNWSLCSAMLQIRDKPGGRLIASVSGEHGTPVSESGIYMGSDGVINVTISHKLTAKMAIERAVYDLFVETPTQTRHKILSGVVSISPAVTQMPLP